MHTIRFVRLTFVVVLRRYVGSQCVPKQHFHSILFVAVSTFGVFLYFLGFKGDIFTHLFVVWVIQDCEKQIMFDGLE